MNTQMRLFSETPHLESDCWLSGTPDILDPYFGDYWTYNTDKPLIQPRCQSALFHGELGYNGEHVVKQLGEIACDGI